MTGVKEFDIQPGRSRSGYFCRDSNQDWGNRLLGPSLTVSTVLALIEPTIQPAKLCGVGFGYHLCVMNHNKSHELSVAKE